MAVINVSAGSEAVLELYDLDANAAITGNALTAPYLQDITITNSTGVFRWQTLDSTSESAAATPATNQISLNLVVDDAAFFGTGSNVDPGVVENGIFGISNAKTEVGFRAYFNGTDSGSKYVEGKGFISGLAPTVNPTAPVWVTPVTIEVNGDYTEAEVA